MTENYYIYILECADKSLYCGSTNDIDNRLAVHNSGKGAKYTRARLPVKLLTWVEFEDKSTALKCEYWFKNKLTRKRKLELIAHSAIKRAFEDSQNLLKEADNQAET